MISGHFEPLLAIVRSMIIGSCEKRAGTASSVSKTQPMKKLVLVILLILPFASKALTRISVQNGNWNSPNTWSPVGVPQLSDDTIIVATDVYFSGQNIYFGNSLFRVAISGQLHGGSSDTVSFGGDVLEINGYTGGIGVLIVAANDSVVNNAQIEVNELIQSGTMINEGWVCVATQITTSDDFVNNGSVNCGSWINSGNVTGVQGQFCIAQNFINTDQISGSIDICDASPGGFGDINTGTISGSVTTCAVGPCMVCVVPGFSENVLEIGVLIMPHPVSSASLIVLETDLLQPNAASIFRITDVQGRIIREIYFTGNQLSFERTGMDAGLYFYSVMLPDGTGAAGKLLVE